MKLHEEEWSRGLGVMNLNLTFALENHFGLAIALPQLLKPFSALIEVKLVNTRDRASNFHIEKSCKAPYLSNTAARFCGIEKGYSNLKQYSKVKNDKKLKN